MGRLRRRHREDYLTHLPFTYCSLARGDDKIAHSFFPPDALAAARWASRTGRPTVMTYAGIPDRVGLVHRRHRLEMTVRAVRASKAVVAISEAAALAFNRWLGVEPEVIFPAVDTEAFSPGGERDPDPTIVFAGAVGEERKRVP